MIDRLNNSLYHYIQFSFEVILRDLKISISGIRGIISQSLTPQLILDYSLAYSKYLRNHMPHPDHKIEIAVGSDTRSSGSMIRYMIFSALISQGINIIDLEFVPTPTILFAVKENKYSGGMMITASHNPGEWNGIKLISHEGQFISSEAWDEINQYYQNKDYHYNPFDKLGILRSDEQIVLKHIQKVMTLVDIKNIQKKHFKIAFDPVNGASFDIIPQILKELNCDIIGIHTDPKKDFQRSPEPLPQNLRDLEDCVLKNKCDIGIAIDPDGDRLSIVSEEGIAIGEEYTLAISADEYLRNNKSDIAVNISTSRMIQDICNKHGVKIYKTAVGEINVLNGMIKNKCRIGGEGNGGVIIPEINSGRDSLVALVMILSAMANTGNSISQLIKDIPKYYFIKDKIDSGKIDLDSVINHLSERYKDGDISRLDGLKVDYKDYWFQIRGSNTEPIIRIFVEANLERLSVDKMNEIKNILKEII